MARPRRVDYTPEEALRLQLAVGLSPATEGDAPSEEPIDTITTLPERIRALLNLADVAHKDPTRMLYLVMYDTSDNRVRTSIANYLIEKGCMRIQKSVYLANSKRGEFAEITKTLGEVQGAYDNEDSILLIPVQSSTVGSMKIIGKNLSLDSLVDPPTTLFY